MTPRAEERRAFVDGTAWRGEPIAPLAADASFRAYYRVGDGKARPSAVLMDAPPGKEDVRPFLAVTRHLRSLDLHAPQVAAADIDRGFLLLEDLGDERMSLRLKAAPPEEERLYRDAVALLARLHAAPAPQRLAVAEGLHYDLPPYDATRLMEEVMLLPDWFLPAASGRPASPEALAAYRALWAPLLAEVAGGPGTLVLRDYHADNLMVTPHGLGLLDYQDAVIGHPAYDLVSLLEDARRDVPPVLAAAMLDHYLALAPVGDEARFRRAFDILGAQRNAKIVGIFARLSRRDGKDRYLDLIPRVWRLLEADLTRLDAAGLIAWLETHIEEAWRRRPLGTAQAKKD